jgi:hypothetical protein
MICATGADAAYTTVIATNISGSYIMSDLTTAITNSVPFQRLIRTAETVLEHDLLWLISKSPGWHRKKCIGGRERFAGARCLRMSMPM